MRRGVPRRPATTAPTAPPTPPPAKTRPSSKPLPCSTRSISSGVSTACGVKAAAFPRLAARIVTQSQRCGRRKVKESPAFTSRSTEPLGTVASAAPVTSPLAASGATSRPRTRMRASERALMAKEAASAVKQPATPMTPTRRPPRAGPMRLWAVTAMEKESAFACVRRLAGTTSGTMAVEAGKKKASADPKTTAMATSSPGWSARACTRIATAPTARPRMASEVSIVRRRGRRSEIAPPSSSNSTIGTMRAATTTERRAGLWLRWSASRASATTKMPSPTRETA